MRPALALLLFAACGPAELDVADNTLSQTSDDVGEALALTGTWQLYAAYAATPATSGITFPCEDDCKGLDAGTYVIATQDVPVLKGDVLVIKAQVEGNNDELYTDKNFEIYARCNTSRATPVTKKDLIRYTQSYGAKDGNHHAATWTGGACSAAADGTVTVALFAESSRDGMTYVANISYEIIEQYRPTSKGAGRNLVGVNTSAHGTGSVFFNTHDTYVPDLAQSVAVNVHDVVYATGQATASHYGGKQDDDMFGIELMNDTSRFTHANENVLYHLPKVTVPEQSIKTMTKTESLLVETQILTNNGTGLYHLQDEDMLQTLVFRVGSAGRPLTGVQSVWPAADQYVVSGKTVAVSPVSFTVTNHGYVDVNSYAQLASTIGDTNNWASCSLQNVVTDTKTGKVAAQSTPHLRTFTKPYVSHPLTNEGVFDLPAGSYSVQGTLLCTGGFGSTALTLKYSGSGSLVLLYDGDL